MEDYLDQELEYLEQALQYVKIKLSITDDEQDELLAALCEDAYDYMCIYFDCDRDSDDNYMPPIQLQFVLESVVIKRYRRIGAEGIAIEKIDVLSTTYESGDDFAEYLDIMNHYKRKNSGKNGPRGFRFF